MAYRTPLAQAMHCALLSYIDEPSSENLTTFHQALSLGDEAAFMETGLHGHSHLIDIFHLPPERCQDKERASDG